MAFSKVEAQGGGGGRRRVTSEIFRDSNGFGVSYRFVGMIMTVPNGPRAETSSLCIHSAPIRFLASLFMLGLINAAFD